MTRVGDMVGDVLAKAVRHLEAYALGLEVAADCERRIFDAYKPEWDRWEARTDPGFKADDKLLSQMRNALDARGNAERIEKDLAAIRAVLTALARESAS